jgi:pyruvate/2-oxoglutarate dehydrogenase complex dihydrolipoamide dehydrogenase (E3) component
VPLHIQLTAPSKLRQLICLTVSGGRLPPSCICALHRPPLGRAGMTDAEARASGRQLLFGSRPMTSVSRAIKKGETQGLMKVVVDAETGKILGAALLGSVGDEAIHAILNIMNAGVPYDELMRSVPIHPTVSELIPTVLSETHP